MMNNIFGFIVLALPVLIPAGLIIAGLVITGVITSRYKVKRTKILLWLAGIFVSLLVPFGDEILGRVYFNYLCAAHGGSIIYKQAELPSEYWSEYGIPSGARKYGFKYEEKNMADYVKLFRIDKIIRKYQDPKTNELLGKLTIFRYRGGWLVSMLGFHLTERCPSGSRVNAQFLTDIFVRNLLDIEDHGKIK